MWEDNIPHALATLNYIRSQLDTTTPDGVGRAVMARTGDAKQAEDARVRALAIVTFESVKQQQAQNGR